jgi:exosome complex exonuclease RRP6
MLEYARSDTHFLLYIYDNMRNELVTSSNFNDPEQDLVQQVLNSSKATCLLRFEHPMYDAERGMGALGWYRQLSRTPALFTKEQFAVFRAVHQWRDDVARQEDESLHYIITNHALFNVAREMPPDRVTMFSVAAPISQPVRLRIDELVGAVSKARSEGAMGPEMHTIMTEIDNFVLSNKPAKTTPFAAVEPAATSTADKSHFALNGASAEAELPPTAAPVVNRATEPLTVSSLWGSVFGSSFWQRKKDKTRDDVRLELPLPALTAEIFENDGMQLDSGPTNTNDTHTQASERPEHEYVKGDARPVQDGQDDVFVVRQLGGKKRKRATAALMGTDAGVRVQALAHAKASTQPHHRLGIDEVDQLGAQADIVDIDMTGHDSGGGRRRKEEKRAKKQVKRDMTHRKAGNVEMNSDQLNEDVREDDVEEEPFDYEAAPSMLNAPRDHKELRKKGRKFDPNSRGLDAPKGLGRTQRERGGRSATFGK